MAKGKDAIAGVADNVRPYVERALRDDRLRDELIRVFAAVRELYGELADDRSRPITLASRVATDDEIRDKLREAIHDLRSATERLQGRPEQRRRSGGRGPAILLVGIALGILFNPLTGPETRRFIRDLLSGESDSDRFLADSNGNS